LKTRAQIYGGEAAGILNFIGMYKALTEEQICRLFPNKNEKIKALLSQLVRQGRIFRDRAGGRYTIDAGGAESDAGLAAAVWVLLDFADKAEYHCAGDFPAKICFFADGELYEIIYAPPEQEVLINHLLAEPDKEPAKRIIIVDHPGQLGCFDAADVAAFCTVAPDGEIIYFRPVTGK
jgi:hypothetical protein